MQNVALVPGFRARPAHFSAHPLALIPPIPPLGGVGALLMLHTRQVAEKIAPDA